MWGASCASLPAASPLSPARGCKGARRWGSTPCCWCTHCVVSQCFKVFAQLIKGVQRQTCQQWEPPVGDRTPATSPLLSAGSGDVSQTTGLSRPVILAFNHSTHMEAYIVTPMHQKECQIAPASSPLPPLARQRACAPHRPAAARVGVHAAGTPDLNNQMQGLIGSTGMRGGCQAGRNRQRGVVHRGRSGRTGRDPRRAAMAAAMPAVRSLVGAQTWAPRACLGWV